MGDRANSPRMRQANFRPYSDAIGSISLCVAPSIARMAPVTSLARGGTEIKRPPINPTSITLISHFSTHSAESVTISSILGAFQSANHQENRGSNFARIIKARIDRLGSSR
jgi:hypothetical protein